MKRYKNIKLIVIGIIVILFSILILFSTGVIGKKNMQQHSQILLNSLVKEIEYYKSQNGKYPDSLKQLESPETFVFIVDPTQSKAGTNYNYKNLGEKYLLFSSGSDERQNTTDDFYPQIKNLKNVGWIKSEATAGNSGLKQ